VSSLIDSKAEINNLRQNSINKVLINQANDSKSVI
jgi:hypothetical protein